MYLTFDKKRRERFGNEHIIMTFLPDKLPL